MLAPDIEVTVFPSLSVLFFSLQPSSFAGQHFTCLAFFLAMVYIIKSHNLPMATQLHTQHLKQPTFPTLAVWQGNTSDG